MRLVGALLIQSAWMLVRKDRVPTHATSPLVTAVRFSLRRVAKSSTGFLIEDFWSERLMIPVSAISLNLELVRQIHLEITDRRAISNDV